MEKKISAGTHTLEEVATYANAKYHAVEFSKTQRIYTEQKKDIKEHLILKYKPEILGDIKEIPKPDVYTEESLRKLHEQIQLRSKMIADIPDHEIPMDFHIYEINIKGGRIEIEIEYIWNIFSISYSGNKKAMKQLKKIAQDLYLYYGVAEEDIRNRSKRYTSLLAILSV